MTEKQLLIVQAQIPKLTGLQRERLKDSLCRELPDYKVLVTDSQFQVSIPSPYQFTERLGSDYSTTVGFPDEKSMRRYVEKQKPGLWYDWSANESNDPNWFAMRGGNLRAYDVATGEPVRKILFYHVETHHLEYRAWAEEDRYAGLIIATCELRFEFDECQPLPANPDAVFQSVDAIDPSVAKYADELGKKAAILDHGFEETTWRDRSPLL